ncbi:MAG: phosphoglycerate kinase [Longimicrobiales bacterium]|jgi:phosphoglycerate kinase
MKTTITDLDPAALSGRNVLVRSDLNVPMESGAIADDQRIQASLPTLQLLRDAGARIVVLSHLGRPKGVPNPEFSLAVVSERLSELLKTPVHFVSDPIGEGGESIVDELRAGEVALLENTRFFPGDTANEAELATRWAGLGDLFVNDAFGAAHRAHASTAGLASKVRAKGGIAVAGLLMAKELRFLGEALRNPERPFVAILGGAKISGKIDVVSALLPEVDHLLIGGAMANTFFRALGHDTGGSLVEPDRIDMARELIERAGEKLVLPVDAVVTDRIEEGAATRVVTLDAVEDGDIIIDVGPETVALFTGLIGSAQTVVWNGPMGVFEIPAFARGTIQVAKALADVCDRGAIGIIGGGDSAAAAEEAGVAHRLTHVSTGGGASLELLAGRVLPGVESLNDKDDVEWP